MIVKYNDNFGKYFDDRVDVKRMEDRKQIQNVGKMSLGERRVTGLHYGKQNCNLPPGC